MRFDTLINIIQNYEKCPSCGASNKDGVLHANIKDETILFHCSYCNWHTKVVTDSNE